ncbi:MAG: MFS transporter [Gammaproteobacteria bacterium]|nr:MFS transporter [Gammaproteobacteria bacterium]
MSWRIYLIALAQFLGTSLWFSANGVADALMASWGIDAAGIGRLTSAVQLGFISGTFLMAFSGLADRYAASRIFFVSALVGALANLAFALASDAWWLALSWRFITGLALAGIYPLGMKLVVTWAPERMGQVLGWLVGMLVLGTSAPHLIRALDVFSDWQAVVMTASVLATLAGVLVLLIGDGPHHPSSGRFDWRAVQKAFGTAAFRRSASGYFGHMWEVYTAWTLAPLLLAMQFPDLASHEVSWLAFAFIAMGALSCVIGGQLSARLGSGRVAWTTLLGSGLCCLVLPLSLDLPAIVFLVLMLAWGFTVAPDSPQFSAMSAAAAPQGTVGSALAVMNGIGFFLSVISIEIMTALWPELGIQVLWLIAPGPALGLWLFLRQRRAHAF